MTSRLRQLEEGVDPSALTDEEKAYASHFIGTLSVRVPAFRNTAEQFAQDLMRHVSQLSASNKEHFENTMRKAMVAAGKPMPDDVEAIRQFALSGDYAIKVDPSFSLQQMVQLAPIIAQYPYNYRWRVLEAPEGCVFLTSDRPLVLVSAMKQPAFFGLGAGWESPWMEATLPLSPRALLLISLHHPDGRETATPAAVAEANMRTATFATRVYSNVPIDTRGLDRGNAWEWWKPLSDALVPSLAKKGAS